MGRKFNIHKAIKIIFFGASEIQYFELGIFSFNSYVYYLTRGSINLLTRDFMHPTCRLISQLMLLHSQLVLLILQLMFLICGFEHVTLEFELVNRNL